MWPKPPNKPNLLKALTRSVLKREPRVRPELPEVHVQCKVLEKRENFQLIFLERTAVLHFDSIRK